VATDRTYEALTEDVIADAVRLRLFAAAFGAREILWNSRGGLQLLDPESANQYGHTLGELDVLIRLLMNAVKKAGVTV
jgi:hypothetical protein